MNATATPAATARTFYTLAFEAAHGTKPRGFGRWIFTRTVWTEGRMSPQEFAASGTYAEAKKAAAKHPLPEGFDNHSEWTVLA